MLARFNRIPIRAKLPAIMVAITLFAAIGIGSVTTHQARKAIEAEAEQRLSGLADSRAEAITTWLDGIRRDLVVQSDSVFVEDALRSFSAGWHSFGEGISEEMRRLYVAGNPNEPSERWKLQDADDGSSWSGAHGFLHQHFVELMQHRGYYDVLLFDVDGNLIYSVAKDEDFGLNFVDGPYAETGLGTAFRQAIALDQGAAPVFVDFQPYAPSAGRPASFMARPIYSSFDQLLGVMAYQLPSDQLDALLLSERGLGATGQTYLVGTDGLLRNQLRGVEEAVSLSRRIEGEAVARALAGESGSVQVTGASGADALGTPPSRAPRSRVRRRR